MSYSVVIPTMGRDALDAAIDSVLKQTYPPSEIIVVAGAKPTISEKHRSQVKLLENPSSTSHMWTASHNRNIGVMEAKSDYVAFLDDDDIWSLDKMRIQMQYLDAHSDMVSISSTNYLLFGFFKFGRPRRRLHVGESILEAHYGKRRILPSPYYTQTSGVVLRRDLALSHPFNEELPYCEDIWWLHELQADGVRIYQHIDKLVQVKANPWRAAKRDSFDKSEAWRSKLRQVNPEFEKNYLRGIGFRNALIKGHFREAFTLWR